MHFVEVAAFRPQRCAVVPYIGAHHPNGFIDTGNELDGNRIYISLVGLAEMARIARIIPPAVPDLTDDLAAANARIAVLEAELAELNKEFDAIDVLASRGFQARKKQGRKKVEA